MPQINNNTSKNEIYEINPATLNSSLGYSGFIDGESLMVVPNLYGEGYNQRNEKITVIKEKGFVLVDGHKTQSGKFENLTDKQLYQLLTAGVILLSDKQRAEFRKKFFQLSEDPETSNRKK